MTNLPLGSYVASEEDRICSHKGTVVSLTTLRNRTQKSILFSLLCRFVLLPWSALEVCSTEKNSIIDLENLAIFCPGQSECYTIKFFANLLKTNTIYLILAVAQLLQMPLYEHAALVPSNTV